MSEDLGPLVRVIFDDGREVEVPSIILLRAIQASEDGIEPLADDDEDDEGDAV